MLTAYNGYYDGNRIVLKDNVTLKVGQEVIITVDTDDCPEERKVPDIGKYRGLGGKISDADAQEYVKGLRDTFYPRFAGYRKTSRQDQG